MNSLATRQVNPAVQRGVLILAGIVGFIALFMLHAALGKLLPLHSDQATVPLYAKAILDGNWGLRGWELTTVSFYTEIPIYMLAIKLIGFQADLMRLVPAFVHTVNVYLIAALIWKYRVRDNLWIFLPWMILAVLPSNGVWFQGLYGPMHHVTALLGYVLLLMLNDRFSLDRFGGRSVALFLVALLATWGDLAFLFVFAAPILATILYRYRADGPLRTQALWSVGAPILLGSIIGHTIVLTMRVAGFGTPGGLSSMIFDEPHRMGIKLSVMALGWTRFFAFDIWGKSLTVPVLCSLVLGFGIVLWAAATRSAVRQNNSAVDVFSVAMPLIVLGFCVLSRRGDSVDDIRMLVPGFMISVLLISRYLQQIAENSYARWSLTVMLVASVVLSAVFLQRNHLMLAGDAYAARVREPAEWLMKRGLTRGFADFWSCHLLRLTSHGRLDLSPVFSVPSGHMVTAYWAADERWILDAKGSFLVISGEFFGDEKFGIPSRDKTEKAAIAYWGKPIERHEIRGMVILIWDEPKKIRYDQYPPELIMRVRDAAKSTRPSP